MAVTLIIPGVPVLDAQQNIQPISEEVFKQISPRAIFIKTSPVQEIKTRLYNRDNLDWDINLLAEMQKSELSHAQHIASILRVNCFEIKDNQSQKFKNLLHQEKAFSCLKYIKEKKPLL